MSFRTRTIANELTTALAVVAVYVLVLLAPLHQAAGLQRDLAGLGFASIDTLQICSSQPQDSDDKQPVVVKCAAAGIGKNELAPVEPPVRALGLLRTAETVSYAAIAAELANHRHVFEGRPRAPPVTV